MKKSVELFMQQQNLNIQEKLDNDEPLTTVEQKWMDRVAKHDPDLVPKKTPAPAPAKEPEPSSTDKLLMQILDELKKD